MQNIVTIDGPSGSGKGTIAKLLASNLGWHLLDSGALYRVLGIMAYRKGIDFSDAEQLAKLVGELELHFEVDPDSGEVVPIVFGENLGRAIRSDEAGQAASKVAPHQPVRDALLALQRASYREPGLVADGRDMGTIVFPDAPVKIFLTASAECRAERRYKQLKSKGIGANMRALLDSIKERDRRDSERQVAPLKPADDALVLDSSEMTIEQVLGAVLARYQSVFA